MPTISTDEISQAIAGCQSLSMALSMLNAFTSQVSTLANNNWQVAVNVGGQVEYATFTPQDQAAITQQYQTLKMALITAYNTLP